MVQAHCKTVRSGLPCIDCLRVPASSRRALSVPHHHRSARRRPACWWTLGWTPTEWIRPLPASACPWGPSGGRAPSPATSDCRSPYACEVPGGRQRAQGAELVNRPAARTCCPRPPWLSSTPPAVNLHLLYLHVGAPTLHSPSFRRLSDLVGADVGLHVGMNIMESFPERCYPARIIQVGVKVFAACICLICSCCVRAPHAGERRRREGAARMRAGRARECLC